MKYTVRKEFHFSAGHQLHLPYESDCNRPHGHNYIVELIVSTPTLDVNGMVLDYNQMEPFGQFIKQFFDHRDLNEVLTVPTTAENIAARLYQEARTLWPNFTLVVRVSETPKTWAEVTETERDKRVGSSI